MAGVVELGNRVLMPLKTHRVDGLMHVKSVEALSPPVGVVWTLGEEDAAEEEIHIRYCMLLEFHKGSDATVATKNICDIYPSALDDRKCQRCFSKFRSGNFDLSDSHRSGRPTTLDNDVIKGASGRKSVSDNRGAVITNLGRPSKNI
ncbi:HTH_48 domain-containing protein [Trichonephila clavipes]|nr:HTH_48 domain-containing protein [Trichonephila clavipes]